MRSVITVPPALAILIKFNFFAYHSDPLQVDLGSAEFLPAIMFVTLPLGNATELSGRLKDVFHQRTTTNFVCWDLMCQETDSYSLFICDYTPIL